MKNTVLRTVVAGVMLAFVGNAAAEEALPDKFRLAIGGFNTTRSDVSLSVTNADAGIGVALDPRDAFDLDSEVTVLRIEGHYRFNPNHALTYSWYNIKTDGEKKTESELEWVNSEGDTITIPIGADLTSSLDTEIFKLGYMWSFYKSEKMEVGIGGGFHITRMEIDLDASLTNPPSSSINNVNTTVPLPVVSLVMNYSVTPKFGWYVKTEAFALKYDNWRGDYRDTLFGMEYRAWRHVGLGTAISINALDIEEDTSKYKFKFDNETIGLLVYLATYF